MSKNRKNRKQQRATEPEIHPAIAAEALRLSMVKRVKGSQAVTDLLREMGGDYYLNALECAVLEKFPTNLIAVLRSALDEIQQVVSAYDACKVTEIAQRREAKITQRAAVLETERATLYAELIERRIQNKVLGRFSTSDRALIEGGRKPKDEDRKVDSDELSKSNDQLAALLQRVRDQLKRASRRPNYDVEAYMASPKREELVGANS